jgi:signal transduction histidine kinase
VRLEHVTSWVASPIVLMGRTWGVLVVSSRSGPLPAGAEDRLAEFSELAGTAIANAESRAELVASRARVVAAADESRRRIQRDLHDGAQQRVVALALKARALAASDAAQFGGIDTELIGLAEGLDGVLQDLREISSGLHPAALSQGGLAPAIAALARRSPTPVALDIRLSRRPSERVEIAAYYVVAEMLANAAKHADAARVCVTAEVHDGTLRVRVGDDGIGGADAGRGSGLVGLADRVEALGGTIALDSPPGGGTTLVAELPLDEPQPDAMS